MPDKLEPLALSKREHFAALIMAGMCANPEISLYTPAGDMATTAIAQADSLIEMLNGGQSSDPEDVAMAELRKDSHQEYYRPSGSTELVEIPESPELDQLRNELYSAEIVLGGGG
jgi:hypothetical protein